MITLRALVPCTRTLASQARIILKTAATNANVPFVAAGRLKPSAQSPLLQHIQQQHRSFANEAGKNSDDLGKQERIYYGSLASRIKAVKVFSLTTSIMGLAAQPILMEQGMKLGGTGMAVFLCTFGGFFTFVTPLLLHFITKKYVTEIHFNPVTEEYTATTISILLQKVQTKFRPSDVKVPDVPGMFTSFLIGKRALFVDPTLFEDTEHYVKIMGYDKPVDFKLDLKESTPATKQQN